jgi:hypothetical protein
MCVKLNTSTGLWQLPLLSLWCVSTTTQNSLKHVYFKLSMIYLPSLSLVRPSSDSQCFWVCHPGKGHDLCVSARGFPYLS